MCGPMLIWRPSMDSMAWVVPSLFIPAMLRMSEAFIFIFGISGGASVDSAGDGAGAALLVLGTSSPNFCSRAQRGDRASRTSEARARIRRGINISACTNPETSKLFPQQKKNSRDYARDGLAQYTWGQPPSAVQWNGAGQSLQITQAP